MTTSEELLRAEAREQARADLFAEGLEQTALEDIDELLHNPGARDEEIFELVGAPVEETIDDYEEVPVVDRDLAWVGGLSALAVAARLQVLSSAGGGLLRIFGHREKNLTGLEISKGDLKTAALAGISKKEIAAAKKELAETGSSDLVGEIIAATNVPTAAAMNQMTPAELLETWEEFGIIPPWNTLQTQAAGNVIRMQELQPGSPQFQASKSALISAGATAGILMIVRRAAQQYTTLKEIDGDVDKELIWVVEGDEATCKNCKANAAEIMTYREWAEKGLPGRATCLGLDRCRCDLLAV